MGDLGIFTKHTLVTPGVFHSSGRLNNGTTPWPNATIPTPAYSGSGEDLALETGINGPTSGGAGNDVKQALGGDVLTLLIESPAQGFTGSPFLIIGEAFTTGSPPFSVIADIHLSFGGFIIVVDGFSPVPPGLTPQLAASGFSASFGLPTGITGTSIILQGLVLSSTAANGIFASTDAHEIQMQ